MLGKQEFDLDYIKSVLEKDNCPVSLGSFSNLADKGENPKILVMFATMDYFEEIKEFCEGLIKRHQAK